MGLQIVQSSPAKQVWTLVARQHGVVARRQLLGLGMSARAIDHRIAIGWLHPVWPGVFAVGRPTLGRHGRWMAATLACGDDAALSHSSAGALWGICRERPGPIELSVPLRVARRHRGLRVHRRTRLERSDFELREGIPLTGIVVTLVDLAARPPPGGLEAAINEADGLDLIDPESLRQAIGVYAGIPGVTRLRRLLDRATFRLTDSELERRFLRIVRSAALQMPETQRHLNGFRVDFFWPKLGLVVETDSLRYHRTPSQQATDRRRDAAHAAAGLTSLRFNHAQVRHSPADVRAALTATASRLRAG